MDLRSEAEISQAVAGVHETLVMRGGEERDWGCVRVEVQLKGVSVHVAEVSDFILQGTAVLESPGECVRKTGGKPPSFPTPRKDEKSQTGGVKASEGGLGHVHLERRRRGSPGSQGSWGHRWSNTELFDLRL